MHDILYVSFYALSKARNGENRGWGCMLHDVLDRAYSTFAIRW